MRSSRALAVAAAACVAVGLSAPLAAAGGDGRGGDGRGGDGRGGDGQLHVSVNPESVHQGGTLTITVQGCHRGGTITSNAFPQTTLPPTRTGVATATAVINDNATLGRHTLIATCNDNQRVGTAQFTVLAGRGAVGGLGGSVGPSSTEMAIGAGLVGAAAVGGGLFIVRRRMVSGKA
jgi:hypothetical protein